MIKDVTNKLLGLPTAEELKSLYREFDFDRKRLAAHLGISVNKLHKMKTQLIGNCVIPPTGTYSKMWNDLQWFTYKYAEWTHPTKAKHCAGNTTDSTEQS